MRLASPYFSPLKIDKEEEFSLNPSQGLVFLGSCFASNLANFWKDSFLRGGESPFGNIYNPLSLKSCINLLKEDSLTRERSIKENLFIHQGLWRHPLFDTKQTDTDKRALAQTLIKNCETFIEQIKEAQGVILTLGTAYTYCDKRSGQVVNNCHKQKGSYFTRSPESLEGLKEALKESIQGLKEINGSLKIILTLSPVRHLRDRATENSYSKALLRCAIEENLKEGVSYFPSYEILLDELRDYRWYAQDLCHPNKEAIEYIMNLFIENYGSQTLRIYLKEAYKIKALQDHKIVNPHSLEAQKFSDSKNKKIGAFCQKYSFVKF